MPTMHELATQGEWVHMSNGRNSWIPGAYADTASRVEEISVVITQALKEGNTSRAEHLIEEKDRLYQQLVDRGLQPAQRAPDENMVWVPGHKRPDGTYVEGTWRARN